MLEWFTEEVWVIPNWGWFAIILGIACLLIAIIIAACVKKGDKPKEKSPEPVLMLGDAEQNEKDAATEPAEATAEPVAEPAAAEVPAAEPVLVEETPVEEKPAAKKTAAKSTATKKATATKSATKTATEEKPATKTTATKTTATKTTAAKTTAAKTTAKAATTENDGADDVKIYHITKREDKKWEVRADGADKALKLFFTQKEAIDYTRKISGKKRILVHKEDGGTREV